MRGTGLTRCRFDPSRFIMEHYVDGDLVNENNKAKRAKASPNNLHIWGKSTPLMNFSLMDDI